MKTKTFLAGLVLLYSGCGTYPPTPIPDKLLSEPIKYNQILFIKEKRTTKAQIQTALGTPNYVFENPERWVYNMRSYMTNRWGICTLWPGDTGCNVYEGSLRYTIYEIEFDKNDLVVETDRSNLKIGECTKRGLCYSDSSIEMRGTTQDPDHR